MTAGSAPWRCTVLLIEDEMLTAMYMEDVLTELGCQVIFVSHIAAALDALHSRRIDGALLDVNVSGVPVYPVAEKLRALGIPFAFVTGYDAGHLPADYRTQLILSKPVATDALVRVLAGFIAQRESALAG